jgi:phosphatidate phosphatase APP1
LLAHPVRVAEARNGTAIRAYRGYGSREEVFLMGRVFRQPGNGSKGREGTLGRDLIDSGRRLLRRGIPGAILKARFAEKETLVITDRDGYFRVHMRPDHPPPTDRLWHPMELELVHPGEAGSRTVGELFVPPSNSRFVVISDIDDTLVHTGVANKVKMIWRLFFQGARSRVAFPGVAAFYRALHQGYSGNDLNPMLYVSRGPWSLYEVLDEFFNLHRIPVGPILFLREWGISLTNPLPRRARGHKLPLIRSMLGLYRDLPIVLIGDSGQRDPEIYTRIVREHARRVLAVYIRNVSRRPERLQAIESLAREVADAGSTLFLAADSFAMAEHAAERGLVSKRALFEVFQERVEDMGKPDLKTTRRVSGEETRAEAESPLIDALKPEGGAGSPPNVVVESKTSKTRTP